MAARSWASYARPGSERPMDKARIPVKVHRRVSLVQTEDAVLAEELLANRKLAQDIVGRLTERVLLIRPGRVEAGFLQLHKIGDAPQVVLWQVNKPRPQPKGLRSALVVGII